MKRSPTQLAADERRRKATYLKQITLVRRYRWLTRNGYDKKTACRWIGVSHATLMTALKAISSNPPSPLR